MLERFIRNLEKQNGTLECINISDNPGRLNLQEFQLQLSHFSLIRKLNLSKAVNRAAGTEPLITIKVLKSWRLEEFILDGININDSTVNVISEYLGNDMSKLLTNLQMNQCNLSGTHVAQMMRYMSPQAGEARNLHLQVSANRLERGHGDIVAAIEEGYGPSQLSMRMVEYVKESHFRQLLEALRTNTTLKCLDISKASLPGDAGDDTCDALQRMFAENTTIEELDISGEHAHLEVARFGIGLNQALTGLKQNRTLKVLRLEHQNLGLEGANTLSSVLGSNDSLTHVYCEHNDISLQGFTMIVNSIASNYTMLELPAMRTDQIAAVKRMMAQISDNRTSMSTKPNGVVKHSVKKTLTTLGVQRKEKAAATPQDIEQAVEILNTRWQRQVDRLSEFLARNQAIADDASLQPEILPEDIMRPSTAMSDYGILEHVLSNTTPRIELTNPVDEVVADDIEKIQMTAENEKSASQVSIIEHERAGSPSLSSSSTTHSASGAPQLPMPALVFDFGDDVAVFDMDD
jgi:hypothetical protein